MHKDKIKNVLTHLGLSSTESRVYLSMLELGPSSVQNVAKKAGVSRTAAYEIIGALQEKGLASTFNKGKKKLFSAEDPDQLQRYFKARLHDMKGMLGALRDMMPELMLAKAGDRPRVRYHKGREGLRALFRDVAAVRTKELREMVDMDKTYNVVGEDLIVSLRSGVSFEHIKVKVLHRGEVRIPRKNSTYRTLKSSLGDFQGIVWVYSNRVAFISLAGELESIIIESDIFSDLMGVMFDAAWGPAEPTKIKK